MMKKKRDFVCFMPWLSLHPVCMALISGQKAARRSAGSLFPRNCRLYGIVAAAWRGKALQPTISGKVAPLIELLLYMSFHNILGFFRCLFRVSSPHDILD